MTAKKKRIIPRPREPNGRISRSQREIDAAYPPAAIKRLAQMAVRDASLEWAGSALGQALLEGKITEQEFYAGKAWREAYSAYLRALDAPSPSPKSAALGHRRAQPIDPDSDAGKNLTQAERHAIKKFMNLHRALLQGGALVEAATRTLVEAEGIKSCSFEDIRRAKTGLAAIYAHLTSGTKNVR